MSIKINKNIISFPEIADASANASATRLLVRHSYRASLQNGNYDPPLTTEGYEYAKECGSFLKGMKDICFGASERKRTMETVQAMIEGANFSADTIFPCPLIRDTAIFQKEETLGEVIEDNTLPQLLQQYFATGCAPRLIDVKDFSAQLFRFLTETEFDKKNLLLASHDIVIVSLLAPFEVYPFQQDDWCGYLQGAFFRQAHNGTWEIFYAVPDKKNRTKHSLFI